LSEIVEHGFELFEFFVEVNPRFRMRRVDAPLAILNLDSCTQCDAPALTWPRIRQHDALHLVAFVVR